MAKTTYKCSNCGHETAKWAGKCIQCNEWNTYEEKQSADVSVRAGTSSQGAARTPSLPAKRVREINANTDTKRFSTGISELDRVLGGGMVPGGVVLLAGEPGAGKSTLTTILAHKFAELGHKSLIVSSEESIDQISLRARRLSATSDNMYIASETSLELSLGHIEDVQPNLIIVDSIQTMASEDISSSSGSIKQVVEVTTVLTRTAKRLGIPLVLIGQVTKEGTIAGPKAVEHLVDVVLHFEGDKDSSLRILRGIKNRYGPADEIGCFEHTDNGLEEVPDPSGLLVGTRNEPIPGVATAIIVEGRRPLPVEVQALVAGSQLPVPRRAVSGLDINRAIMVQAVLERHGRIQLANKDIYISTIAGMRTKEPSMDLALAIALVSAQRNVALPLHTAIMGEVALSGEVRPVRGSLRRVREAQRLGFKNLILPHDPHLDVRSVKGMNIMEVRTIQDALRHLDQIAHPID